MKGKTIQRPVRMGRPKAKSWTRRDRLTHFRADSLRRLEWLRLAKASGGLLIRDLPNRP